MSERMVGKDKNRISDPLCECNVNRLNSLGMGQMVCLPNHSNLPCKASAETGYLESERVTLETLDYTPGQRDSA